MRQMERTAIALIVAVLALAFTATADVPKMINYQGYLTDAEGDALDTTVSIEFAIYDDSTGGVVKWVEAYPSVTVGEGIFTVILGETVPIDDGVFNQPGRWLGITIGADPEMAPRTRFVAVPYAYSSLRADTADAALSAADAATLDGQGPSFYVDWMNLTNIPADIADGDDVNTDWNSLTNVPADIADGDDVDTDWDHLTNVPADIADGDDVTTDWDSLTNIPADIADGDDVDTDWDHLINVPADIADGDDVNTDWNSLTNVPADIADGDDVDTDWNSLTNVPADIADGDDVDTDWNSLTNVPADIADGDDVDVNWTHFTNVPAGFADGVDNVDVNWTHFTNVPAGFADGVDNVDVLWSHLTGVPAGFADGVDDVGGGSNWTVSGSVLYTNSQWGIARGGTSNNLYGNQAHTMVNLGNFSTVGISGQNLRYATISGGSGALASGSYSTVGGGYHNTASLNYSTVSGGGDNTASGVYSTVGGGMDNQASFEFVTIGGGRDNTASGDGATISGGYHNAANGGVATVSGGSNNAASGEYATVSGGSNNAASGNVSFAAGYRAKATHHGSFVWADRTSADFNSGAADRFHVRASGGVYLYTNAALTSGMYLAAGGSSWNTVSDSTLKRNIREVNYQDIMNKVGSLPVSQWSYKAQDESIEHVGPMAQDFHRLFGLGDDDTHVNTLDLDGISLAAIKGLYEMSQEQKVQIDKQETEISALKAQLTSLSELVEVILAQQGDNNSPNGQLADNK